jgi:aminomethyltransferase
MENEVLLETPLAALHQAAGAKMVPFAGWNMPVQYANGIIAEHLHTRHQVSIFDICHMGEFKVSGAGAEMALDHILARPVFDQKIGSCRYNFLLDPDGKVLDDLIVYRMAETAFFIVVNAGTRFSDAEQIASELPEGILFEDVSDATGKIDLQGPASAAALEAAGMKIAELPGYFAWKKTAVNGIDCLLSRTGYTGELGFELYLPMNKTAAVWEYLMTLPNVMPAGLGARDTLRLEMGYALYGHELNLHTTPIEAGYGAMLRIEELPNRKFIGKNALCGDIPAKKLFGIKLDGRRAAREGAQVFNPAGDKVIGKVTSGAFAPSLGCAVAMAYLNTDEGAAYQAGDTVMLEAGRAVIPGMICMPPFYGAGTARIKL